DRLEHRGQVEGVRQIFAVQDHARPGKLYTEQLARNAERQRRHYELAEYRWRPGLYDVARHGFEFPRQLRHARRRLFGSRVCSGRKGTGSVLAEQPLVYALREGYAVDLLPQHRHQRPDLVELWQGKLLVPAPASLFLQRQDFPPEGLP